ncbi:phage protease [Ralstonia syzygii subsp. celebesensis]
MLVACPLSVNVQDAVGISNIQDYQGFFGSITKANAWTAWQLDAAIAARVIALATQQKNDILIDWDHQRLNKARNGQCAEAAGWIPRTLEWRVGLGLPSMGLPAWVSSVSCWL